MRTTFLWSVWATWEDLDSSINEKNYWTTSIMFPHSEIHNVFNMKEYLPSVLCMYTDICTLMNISIYTHIFICGHLMHWSAFSLCSIDVRLLTQEIAYFLFILPLYFLFTLYPQLTSFFFYV